MLSNKVYDILKFIALIILPAVATLIGTLGNIWHWNYIEQIVPSITAIDVFLGAILGISSIKYNERGE